MSTDARLTFSLGLREEQQPMGWSLPTSLRPLQISYTRRVPPDAVRAAVKMNPTHMQQPYLRRGSAVRAAQDCAHR